MNNAIRSIGIVGGGTAGWMAASLLSSLLQKSNIKITLIESPDIPTVGVGESTVPSIVDFLRTCRIDLQEFVKATSASFKLGIQFDSWQEPGKHYFHPFGRVGQDINGFAFYQAWMKARAEGYEAQLLDHAPGAVMARQERFALRPAQPPNWTMGSYSYALHLDATKVVKYLREFSGKYGVDRIEATVNKVQLDEQQYIKSVELDNGESVKSDFFIDCTGFKGLLISEALKVGYQDWTHYLPCNRAVTVQTKNTREPLPYTQATARKAGWSWRIPLQSRTGNGYVFCDRYCSDDEATQTLLGLIDGERLNEPRVIPFATGQRDKIWYKNCLALGLSSGFLEPLESTAIHLVYKTLTHFIRHFPDRDFDLGNEQTFNNKINADYLEIRDFIILHYATANRDDTDFWRWCQTMPLPDSLHDKIKLFRERGHLDDPPGQFFTSDSWLSILHGSGLMPEKYHPLMDAFDGQMLAQQLSNSAQQISQTLKGMPKHGDFIRQHCAAKNDI
jgi:tryptophan halogenase